MDAAQMVLGIDGANLSWFCPTSIKWLDLVEAKSFELGKQTAGRNCKCFECLQGNMRWPSKLRIYPNARENIPNVWEAPQLNFSEQCWRATIIRHWCFSACKFLHNYFSVSAFKSSQLPRVQADALAGFATFPSDCALRLKSNP